MGLSGRLAVVTGVTSGIGESLTTRLLSEGMTVAGIARDRERLDAAAARWGSRFIPVLADLAVPEARGRMVQALVARFDRVDVLVNNAAEVVYETPLGLPMQGWRQLMEVNLLAGVELAQGVAPRMPKGAHVVNVSSATARFLPNARFAPYALTKAAIESFTEALRLELDPRGIKITVVVPGLVNTPIYDRVENFANTRARISEQIPEWLSADDIAEAIVWILARPAHVVVSEVVILPQGQAR